MMKKSTAYIIIAALSVALIVTGLFAWKESQEGLDAWRAGQNYGSTAMGELASSLSSMDEALRESTYATNAPLFSQLCAKAAANASGAVSALSAMPYTTTELEKLSGYINGAGDWALYLSREGAEGRLPTRRRWSSCGRYPPPSPTSPAPGLRARHPVHRGRAEARQLRRRRRGRRGEHHRRRAAAHRLRARRVPGARLRRQIFRLGPLGHGQVPRRRGERHGGGGKVHSRGLPRRGRVRARERGPRRLRPALLELQHRGGRGRLPHDKRL